MRQMKWRPHSSRSTSLCGSILQRMSPPKPSSPRKPPPTPTWHKSLPVRPRWETNAEAQRATGICAQLDACTVRERSLEHFIMRVHQAYVVLQFTMVSWTTREDWLISQGRGGHRPLWSLPGTVWNLSGKINLPMHSWFPKSQHRHWIATPQ